VTEVIDPEHARVRARRIRRGLRYLVVALAALAAVLFFVFVSASATGEFFERNYTLLLWLNAGLLVLLLLTVLVLAFRLWQRWRNGRFGARLMARLALLFILIGVLPGVLIYTVSVQFLGRSLESWFNPRVDAALEAGLNLGRSALDAFKSDAAAKARAMALELADATPGMVGTLLIRLREQAQVGEAIVFTANGRLIASAGGGITLVPDVPSGATLARLRVTRFVVQIEGDASGDPNAGGALRVRAIVLIPRSAASLDLDAEQRYLQIVQTMSPQFAQNAQSVEAVYQDYQKLSLAREGLRKIYAITLTMTLLLAAFAAMVAALIMATRFARPLLMLAEGTRAVAGGDYRPLPETGTRDEIEALTQSFNAMTSQLGEARAQVLSREAELERANSFLSSVLANISTGVLVFDPQFRLITANAAAGDILGDALLHSSGVSIDDLPAISAIATELRAQFETELRDLAWQHEFEIDRGDAGSLVLLARGSRLALAAGLGHVIVFDDISDVISAQRAVAWSEVARRVAHEIKNPLTPIQLSAERLEKKLADKLSPEDAAILRRGATTIVAQVAAMKHMVDEFREYARMPPTQLMQLDLNGLVEDVLGLYAGADRGLRVELGSKLPAIEGDASQLRQVIHNLLQNAQDSVAARLQTGEIGLDDLGQPRVIVRTGALEYVAADGTRHDAVRLEVQDRGTGFNPKLLHRAFEPYVTTKARGTGLGLAIVRKIVEEHGARVELQNVDSGGALVTITFFRLARS